ncbi:aminotransferase class IV [Roseiterribacter gracilis]|uniref:Probable branched-chain-amino-acid aminotransferase n=1 Tax=Roseiterribacter gracilis TaxID=2812848 RepID=A0A8S8XGW9_9PROT|nr:2-keto-4-methylthiobutyrate aminotransferase [Rhodospirillales bacterium TMPK1]
MNELIWIDGEIVDIARARIDPRDRGFTLGDGLYETVRVRNGVPTRVAAHVMRLVRGCALLGFPPPIDPHEFDDVMRRFLVTTDTVGDAALRLTLSRGPGPRGLTPPEHPKPTLTMLIAPWTKPAPVAAITARVARRDETSPLCTIKHTNTLDAILARREAASHNADEAVLLNHKGNIAEATIANLFAVIDGTLVTPPSSDGCLPGVARAEILERAGGVERTITPNDLARADEIFFSSALGIRSAIAMDGRTLSSRSVAESLPL